VTLFAIAMTNGMAIETVLEARGLTRKYVQKRLAGRERVVAAVDNVSLAIDKGSVMALVGASGSGKSSLVRCLLGLERPSGGTVFYRGTDISLFTRAQAFEFRRKVQLVFQDASAALNPRFTAAAAIAEPLTIAGIGTPARRRIEAMRWMSEVHLLPEMAGRPALEFSGGQRQRLAIARALIGNPELVIFDEAFSALDNSVQGHLVELLCELRRAHDFTCVLVSHDLTFLGRICETVAVMNQGKIVEQTSMDALLSSPRHPCSQELVRAISRLPPRKRRVESEAVTEPPASASGNG
jgi:ABC-type glutathione transport system ATPase component